MHDAARAMIDAAERIVAERGLASLTVQSVQTAAGQRNKSAVQYHFGGRDGLLRALLADRMAPTEARRTEMLLALDDSATVRDLVEVLVLPLIESVLARTPSYWARFLIQAINDPTTGLAALDAVVSQAFRAAQHRLEQRLDHLPGPLRRLRVQSAFGYAAVVLATHEIGALPHVDPDVLATEIVDACCGLVDAPSTAAVAPAPTNEGHA